MPTLSSAIKDFFNYATVEKGYADRTVQTYRYNLSYLFNHLGDVDTNSLTAASVRSYLAERKSKGLKSKTLAGDIGVLRTFCAFLQREEYVSKNPAATLATPKYERGAIKYFTDEQRQRLLSTPIKPYKLHHYLTNGSYYSARDKTAWYIFAHTGIRREELVNLNVDDIDLGQALLTVQEGKGGKPRTVPLSKTLVEILDKYLHRRLPIGENRALFLSLQRNRWSIKAVSGAFKRHLNHCGLPETLAPHALRHGLATSLVRKKVDLVSVQKILGHANLATTEIYVHLELEDLRSAVELL